MPPRQNGRLLVMLPEYRPGLQCYGSRATPESPDVRPTAGDGCRGDRISLYFNVILTVPYRRDVPLRPRD